MSDKQDLKKKRIRARVLKEILDLYHKRGGAPLDIETAREQLKHIKGIDSGKKVMEAVDALVASGDLVMTNGTITPPTTPKAKSSSTPTSTDPNLIYGRVVKVSHDNLVFIPNDKRDVTGQVLLLNDRKTLPRFENKLVTLALSNGGPNARPMGTIVDILGDAGNPIAEYDTIAQAHGAIMCWTDPLIQAEIDKIPLEVKDTDYNLSTEDGVIIKDNGAGETVVDLTHINFTTTDPATCRDMDDAIYSTYDENGNIVIYTAVADVSRYVDPNSEIGKLYFRGGFTFYASNKAYNILPTELSTGICSLNPGVNRMAFVIKTTIDQRTGKPIESKFMNAMIRSREKFSYEQAQHIVDTCPTYTPMHLLDKCKAGVPLNREEQVVMNKVASDLLTKGFSTRHSVQFSTRNEYKPIFSEDGLQIVGMAEEEHCDYHKVIENFMITANEEAARFALEHNIPIVYRVHDEPNERKVDQAMEFFGYLRIPFDGDLSPYGTKHILEMVKGTSKEKAVNNFLVRMQSKAKYSISTDPKSVELMAMSTSPGNIHRDHRFVSKKLESLNRGARSQAMAELIDSIKQEEKTISHFGLQSAHYSHTTSPIRRITDYITHYNIKAFINHTPMLPMSFVREIAMWANEREYEIAQAEREQQEFNSALYASTHINEVMKGRVCGFRSLVEGKISGAQDIMVLVENEDTGIKVQVPAVMLLGGSTKDVCISKYGNAIVKRSGTKPYITLCQEVTFKIAEASTITKTVYASTNLTADYTKTNFLQEVADYGTHSATIPFETPTVTPTPVPTETKPTKKIPEETHRSRRPHSQSYKSYREQLEYWENYSYEDDMEDVDNSTIDDDTM